MGCAMPSVLEMLQGRLEAARALVVAAEADLAAARLACDVWRAAIEIESRQSGQAVEKPGPSKSQYLSVLLQETIRQHPEGITSVELLRKLEGQFPKSTYVYGVLKRLRDRGLVEVTKDGRYILKAEKEVPSEEKTS
jgi:uncharacterized membrane protein